MSYDRMSRLHPDIGERVLLASGHRGVGNRIPGSIVLRDAGWDIHDAFEMVGELQQWSRIVFDASAFDGDPYWQLRHLERRLREGTRHFQANGGTGECRCLMCRIRRLWVADLEDAMSEL